MMTILLLAELDRIQVPRLAADALDVMGDFLDSIEPEDREYTALVAQARQLGLCPEVRYVWRDLSGDRRMFTSDLSYFTTGLPEILGELLVNSMAEFYLDETSRLECVGGDVVEMTWVDVTPGAVIRSSPGRRVSKLARQEFLSMIRLFLGTYEALARRACLPDLLGKEFDFWLGRSHLALDRA